MADMDLKDLKNFGEAAKKMSEASSEADSKLSKLRTRLDDLKKSSPGATAEIAALTSEFNKARKASEDLSDQSEIFGKIQKSVADVFPKAIKNIGAYNSHLQEVTRTYKDQLEDAKNLGKITADQYDQMMKDVDEFKDKLAEVSSEPIKFVMRAESKDIEKAREARRKVAEMTGGGLRGGLGGLSAVTGIKSKTISGAGDAFEGVWKGGLKIQDSFKGVTEMLSAAGKGASIFSAALNILGMAFKANPIGLLIGAIAMVGSVVNDLDQMIKGLNKSWREMAGSPALLKDIRGSMRAFNDAIFNLERNMRLGLKASDINEFFKTMSSAGLSTEGVNKRIGSFNQAIEQGFILSRKFGVSFSEMGQMMSSQMLDLRSSLEDVSEAFKGMSYDAAVAGVQSQKFYQVVESASMSLSFYGNFLKSTSARLRDFVQTGTMGFKDASQTVQDLMNTYKSMGMDQRRAIVNIIGEDEMKKLFKERETEMAKEIGDLGDKMRKIPTGTKEYAAAKMRLAAMKGDLRNLREARRTGDVTALGSMLEVLSDKVLGAAAKVLERTGVDFFEDKAAAFAILQNQFGWNIDMVNKAFKKANVSMDIMRTGSGKLQEALADSADPAAFAKLSDRVRSFITDPATSPFSSFEVMAKEVKETLTAQLGKTGASGEIAPMLDLLSQSEEGFADFLDYVLKRSNKTMNQIATGTAVGTRVREKTETTESQLDEMIKQTTPIADYLDIGKENVKYALASSNLQNTMAIGITETARKAGGILKFLTGQYHRSKGGKGREEEFARKGAAGVEDVYSRMKMIDTLLEKIPETSQTKPEIEALKAKRRELETEAEKLSSTWEDVPVVLEKARDSAYSAAETWSNGLVDSEKRMAENEKTLADYNARLATGNVVGEARVNLLNNQRLAQEAYNKAYEEHYALLLKYGDLTKAASKEKNKGGDYNVANILSKGSWNVAKEGPVPEAQDFSALTEGWVKVSPKDVVINGDSLSKGMGMGKGQMMTAGPGIMKGAGVGGGAFTMGNVELNFNAPLNGNPEEYRKMFVEAVNDVVNKRLYEEKSR